MTVSRRSLLRLIAIAGGSLVPLRAKAESYPSRPITMIVPFAAGGPADAFGRIIAERMQRALGQPVIIEDVPGAAGTIATAKVAHASQDGYTLLIGPGFALAVINPAIYGQSVVADLEPVAMLSAPVNVIVGRKSLPADNLGGLITWLKSNPDQALQGTSGVGSFGHLAGVLFQKETGTKYKFVPYRGLGPALQDLLAGRVDLMIDVLLNSLQYIRAGSLKAYAVLSEARVAIAPNIPTVREAGLPSLNVPAWYAIFAPKGTPKEIVGRLNGAVIETLADPVLAKHLAQLGHEIVPRDQQTSEALAAQQRADQDKWWPIIKAAGIKAE
jgi:tripartite-type tricarboxylate transporter receptor subunit TctC